MKTIKFIKFLCQKLYFGILFISIVISKRRTMNSNYTNNLMSLDRAD